MEEGTHVPMVVLIWGDMYPTRGSSTGVEGTAKISFGKGTPMRLGRQTHGITTLCQTDSAPVVEIVRLLSSAPGPVLASGIAKQTLNVAALPASRLGAPLP